MPSVYVLSTKKSPRRWGVGFGGRVNLGTTDRAFGLDRRAAQPKAAWAAARRAMGTRKGEHET